MSYAGGKPTGWCMIPPWVLARKDLSGEQKLLFGRILGLSDRHGYCWASNAWLGNELGLAPGTVSNMLSRLSELGLVKVELVRKGQKKTLRRLYPLGLADHSIVEWSGGGTTPSVDGVVGGTTPSVDGPRVEVKELQGRNTGSAVADRQSQKSRRASFKVDRETMTLLVNSYCELKGVKLNGDEYLPVQQAMKSMLMAGHTSEEIIGLMRAFAESTEEWAQSWTFRTVKMKLPEWKAGKLELNGQRCRRDVRDDVTERLEELRRQLRMIDAEISVLNSMHVLSEEEMQRLGELEERREALVQEGLKLRERGKYVKVCNAE